MKLILNETTQFLYEDKVLNNNKEYEFKDGKIGDRFYNAGAFVSDLSKDENSAIVYLVKQVGDDKFEEVDSKVVFLNESVEFYDTHTEAKVTMKFTLAK